MAAQNARDTSTGMQPTLGLTGVTINAMVLIAPGAFLWTTFQAQSAPGSASNMWFAVFIATAIAFLTAIAYASLSSVAIALALVWLVGGFTFLFIRKAVKGTPIFHSEDHKEKLAEINAAAAVTAN